MQPADAEAALRDLDGSRSRLADVQTEVPLARHLAFGLLMGLVPAAQALGHGASTVGSVSVIMRALLLQKWDRRRTGVFINGFRPGRTRIITLAMLAMMIGLLVPAVRYGASGVVWVPLAIGGVAAVIGTLTSILWYRIYIGDLRRGAAS